MSKLLKEITVVHPVEVQPPISSGFVTPLRHYQKQSLAFMVDTEKKFDRGGWLADEVGMGKVSQLSLFLSITYSLSCLTCLSSHSYSLLLYLHLWHQI